MGENKSTAYTRDTVTIQDGGNTITTDDEYLRWGSLKVLNGETVTPSELRRDSALINLSLYSYHGRAPDGTATSAGGWEVMRFTHAAAGNIGETVRIQYLTGAWDDRATLGWS